MAVTDAAGLAERIRAVPGVDRLAPALEGLPPAWLVGGAVRDLLLGRAGGVDLDVAVEGDAADAAQAIAERLGGEARVHDRFGTATVRAGALTVDLARTRRERYPAPGALPDVEPAPLDEDLARRDLTINAMAAALSPDRLGELRDPHGGRADLAAGRVRVLHPRSFEDDPTRLLRAARYAARLGFRLDPETERLARSAAEDGALATLSGPRVRDALLLALGERRVGEVVRLLADLGIARGLHPALAADQALAERAAAAAAEVAGADRALTVLAALAGGLSEEEARGWLDALALPAPERERVAGAAAGAAPLAAALAGAQAPSALRLLLDPQPPEALALALALGGPAEPVRAYLGGLRHVRLEISGDDLIAAGVPASPALGRALEETLRRKLDGEVAGRDDELRTALSLAREPAR